MSIFNVFKRPFSSKVLAVEALEGTLNKEKALEGAFSPSWGTAKFREVLLTALFSGPNICIQFLCSAVESRV